MVKKGSSEHHVHKSILYGRIEPSSRVPKLIRFLMNAGIANSSSQANVLVVTFAIAAIFTAYLLFSSGVAPTINIPQIGDDVDFSNTPFVEQ